MQTPMCELSSPGKRHFEFDARICYISVIELRVVDRYGELYQQLQKNNISPQKTSIVNRHFSIMCSKRFFFFLLCARDSRCSRYNRNFACGGWRSTICRPKHLLLALGERFEMMKKKRDKKKRYTAKWWKAEGLVIKETIRSRRSLQLPSSPNPLLTVTLLHLIEESVLIYC